MSSEGYSVFRTLFIEILAASHDPRFADELLAAVGRTELPSPQWAVLAACRYDPGLCDEVAKRYLEREHIPWLENFWLLRHPVDPPQASVTDARP